MTPACVAPRHDSGGREAGTAYERAVRRLGRRDHTEREICDALRAEGYPEDDIADAVRRLAGQGVVDDVQLSERFVRRGLQSRRVGRARLLHELEARGVADADAARGTAQALAEASEAEAVDALVLRHRDSLSGPAQPLERRVRRLVALLLRRGFPPALVARRLRALWPEAARLEHFHDD